MEEFLTNPTLELTIRLRPGLSAKYIFTKHALLQASTYALGIIFSCVLQLSLFLHILFFSAHHDPALLVSIVIYNL